MPEYTGEPVDGIGGNVGGADAFIVPRDFIEFYERYPVYVRNWVSKKLRKVSTHPDVEDWTNTLLAHICAVPKGKVVEATDEEEEKIVGGSLAKRGFVDVINAFNPWAQYGASAKRFFSFVNTCLSNKYSSLTSKHRKDAMWHQQFSLDDAMPGASSASHDSPSQESGREYLLISRSSLYAEEVGKAIPKTADEILVEQFKEFLTRRDPSLIPLVEALMHKDKIEEILTHLEIDHNNFLRNRKKLQRLSRIFVGSGKR